MWAGSCGSVGTLKCLESGAGCCALCVGHRRTVALVGARILLWTLWRRGVHAGMYSGKVGLCARGAGGLPRWWTLACWWLLEVPLPHCLVLHWARCFLLHRPCCARCPGVLAAAGLAVWRRCVALCGARTRGLSRLTRGACCVAERVLDATALLGAEGCRGACCMGIAAGQGCTRAARPSAMPQLSAGCCSSAPLCLGVW